MKKREFRNSLTTKWWYIQLWKINKLRKQYQHYLKFTFEVLPKNKDKGKVVDSDYDLGKNLKLYYWRYDENYEHNQNLGDYLSKVVVEHYMPKNKMTSTGTVPKTLYAIGSILGFRCQDAVVWGSGFLSKNPNITQKARFSSLDIRAVRGPKTRELLLKLGKKCPEVYGDPAILMPEIYMPKQKEKKYDVSIVLHYLDKDMAVPDGINKIDIITDDYERFIDEIVSSKLVISTSLHGVILAETYGVPAIFLSEGAKRVPFKYEDWYNSTGRYDITFANSIEQALIMEPMSLPCFDDMRKKLLQAFPYDLWD